MKRHRIVTFLSLLTSLCLIGAFAPAAAEPPPEDVSRHVSVAAGGMVAADHPLASEVGAGILAAGGTAADAGAATLLALGVVNPFASGLGGGGFCLYRPAGEEVKVLDFREEAPGKAHRDMFVVDGEPDIKMMLRGGKAVGVPGEPAGLHALHGRWGRKTWAEVVQPAEDLARDGFPAGTLLPCRLEYKEDALEEHEELASVFRKDGEWIQPGERLRRPGLAKALELYRKEGPKPFYEGPIAASIVERVNAAGGIFQAPDLKKYDVVWRAPVRGEYRGYEIFSMPPPSSGGTTIVETLNILEGYDLGTLGRSIETTHRVAEALKHAFADRARWLGDSDFVDVPVDELTSEEYAEKLRRKIRPDGVLPVEGYGTRAPFPDDAGTTHVSIIDGEGNMLACTSTINTSFGSMVFVSEYGLVMNNEMGDFTPQPGAANNYGLVGTEQNAVAPGKRPLSSMSPTLVLRDGEPFLAVGASGGPTIITGTLLAILRLVDFRRSPVEAVTLPRIHHQWLPNILFFEQEDPVAFEILERRGHEVEQRRAYNSVQLVVRKPDGTLVGVSDPRKHGRPVGTPGRRRGPADEKAQP